MTIDDMIKKIKPIHNHICILYDSELVRVVGVAEDKHDLYYIVRYIRNHNLDKPQYWASAVGHLISLKDSYPKERYKYMDELFSLNGAPASKEFIVELED